MRSTSPMKTSRQFLYVKSKSNQAMFFYATDYLMMTEKTYWRKHNLFGLLYFNRSYSIGLCSRSILTSVSFNCSTDHDRIRLKVVGTQCTIHGTNALEKDQGIWDFYVSAGKDGAYHKKHYQFHVSVNGKNDTTQIYFGIEYAILL